MSTTQTGRRTEARSMIEELWAEREQARPSQRDGAPPPSAPRPRANGKERALATAIVFLLVSNGLGIGAKALGLIGAPSKEAFLVKADAICTPGNATVASISKPTGYVTLAKAASTLATTTDTQLGQLRALELPGYADRGRARSVIDALGASAGAGRTLQAGAETSDPAVTANASRAMSKHAKDARAKAEAFGFSACVSGMQPGVDAVVAGASGAVKQSFIEKGELLCTQWLESGDALPQPRSLAEGQHFFRQVQAIMETFAGGLKALPVAPGDEAVVAELLAELAKLSGAIRQLEAAAINGDVKRVNAIDKEGDAIAEAIDRRLSAYGFSNCGPDD